MTISLKRTGPVNADTKRQAFAYAARSAAFALMRGEASIALRTARQLALAQANEFAQHELLTDALAACDKAKDTVARGAGDPAPEMIDAVAAAHLALGETLKASELWLGLARSDPTNVDAFLSFAWCMARLGNDQQATQIATRISAIGSHPKIDAIQMMVAISQGDETAALAHARNALSSGPDAEAWLPIGAAFEIAGAADAETFALGRELDQLSSTAHLGPILHAIDQGQYQDAVAAADNILTLVPDDERAGMLKINALMKSGHHIAAAHAQAELLSKIGPRIDKLISLLDLLNEIDAHEEILELGKIIRPQRPDNHDLAFFLAWSAASVGDMDLVDEIHRSLPSPTSIKRENISPFTAMRLFDDASFQMAVAATYCSGLAPIAQVPSDLAVPNDGPIKIGYYSNDYHHHATMSLITEVLELTDRERFEIVAYSYDRKPNNPQRERLVAAVDRFVDVQDLANEAIAQRVRADGIHILVDLKGHTDGSRSDALRHRLAPIQVNWLGYPGTYGMAEVDYIIADSFIIPPGEETHFSEQIVRLPGCYQPNGHRTVKEVPTRAQVGLPPTGFVFAAFHQTYKVSSTHFAAWMEILRAVPGSILWILSKNERTDGRFLDQAKLHGINRQRIVFARPIPMASHLARYGLVDLALDTYPVGSHTTASDALWVGAPLLAQIGQSFVSRVAGSILQAAGMSELITYDLDAYKAKAVELGNNSLKAHALHQTLLASRDSSPLFDAARFAGHLGSAFETMVQIWRAGERPRSFNV